MSCWQDGTARGRLPCCVPRLPQSRSNQSCRKTLPDARRPLSMVHWFQTWQFKMCRMWKWRFPEMGVLLLIIHFNGISINFFFHHPAIGVSPILGNPQIAFRRIQCRRFPQLGSPTELQSSWQWRPSAVVGGRPVLGHGRHPGIAGKAMPKRLETTNPIGHLGTTSGVPS